MDIIEYFEDKGIIWFPINLEFNEGKKIIQPYKETGQRPTTHDFDNLNLVQERKKYKYKYGAVDTRTFNHIDVDMIDNTTYTEETHKFVEDLKENVPYFPSIVKRNPHFIYEKNEKLPKKLRIQTRHKDIEILSGQWSWFKLEDKVINSKKKIIQLDEGIVPDIEIKPKKIKSEPILIETENKQINKNIEKVVDMIDIKYINDYDTWTKLVWSLHNDNPNNYEVAKMMSMKSSKFDDDFFNKLWAESRAGCNIGTIHYYAYKSDPNKYIVLNPSDHLTGTDDNLSKIFLNIECENIHYIDQDNIFLFTNNKWIQDNKNLYLKSLIRKTLIEYVKNINLDLLNKGAEEYADKLKSIQKIMVKVSSCKTIDSVCKFVIQDLSTNPKTELFNINENQIYNLHFINGVLNLKTKEFRKRKKSDLVTLILDWEYESDINEKAVEDVNDFFRRVQPDEKQRRFLIEWLGYCLSGDINKQKFKVNIGYTAQNGKSTEFLIHHTIFPIYTHKLDSRTFNQAYENKRHKQLIKLLKEPIRFVYCEELDHKRLDTDFLKDFVTGQNINVEVLFGTTESNSIQAKLNTCSNKDFNIEKDAGILRRGLVQMYESQFLSNVEDNYETNKFKCVDNYIDIFNSPEYKNAYLHILLSNFSLNPFIPKLNEQLFKDITDEYDTFKETFDKCFEITENKEDIIYKETIEDNLRTYDNKLNNRTIRQELKKLGITYDRLKYKNNKRGYFLGIKEIDHIETDNEEI
tara:strand:+ start:115 stop:2355 length:2241 start_codon:yes stop_codon:yes gene_type:complete